jgi:lipid A ethanolaminephosphotransferase
MHTAASRPETLKLPTSGVLQSLRQRWSAGARCPSDVAFAFGASFLWVSFYNVRFWQDTLAAMWHGTLGSVAFLGSLFLFVWCVQALLLLLIPTRRLMVGVASILFVIASIASYFSLKYGIVMNTDMLRNVFETDAAETRSLVSIDLVLRVFVMGFLPAALVWKVRLPAMRWSRRLRNRSIAIVGILAVCALSMLSASASYAVFFREHKPIRFSLMPAAPFTSALGLLFEDGRRGAGPIVNVSGTSARTSAPHAKPLVVVMVVGETARAKNFELGGYARHTNPELAAMDGLVYFPDATSCGTATAISVPCMFSHLSRKSFDVDAAPRFANLLDALQNAGVNVEWRDNNAGCKGVCARVHTINYRPDADPQLCRGSYCYDEIMLQDLAGKLETLTSDTVIVMHQIGSHGPAYAERYPPEFEKFKPACHSNQLQNCTPQEVVNAYDNTIAYTDHMLAQTIETLRRASEHVDAMVMYASDHGESLGEQGLYLHGLPYAFAPETQKRVPMLMWLSRSFAASGGVSIECLEAHAGQARSHDNIYHTILGAAAVRNSSYDASLDILAACRTRRWPNDHE